MNQPRLSVITTNYNQAGFLRRALEAIVSQSRPPDEYVIIDDGSTDGSAGLIESYAKRHSFMRFIRHEKNRGFFASVTEARGLLTGEYVYGCSSDDYPLPGFFEKAMTLAGQYPQAGLITGPAVGINSRGHRLAVLRASRWKASGYKNPQEFRSDYLEVELPGHTLGASTVYRRAALREAGDFRPDLGLFCDLFAIRTLGLKTGICYIAEPCAAFSIIPESISQATLHDCDQVLGYIAKTAHLMRSDEFRPVFTEAYAARWEREYTRLILFYHRPFIRRVVKTAAVLADFKPVGWMVPYGETLFRKFCASKLFRGR